MCSLCICALGFVECALPSVTTVFINQPKQLHFQKCWMKTVHYEQYTQRAGHLDLCIIERVVFTIHPFHLCNLSSTPTFTQIIIFTLCSYNCHVLFCFLGCHYLLWLYKTYTCIMHLSRSTPTTELKKYLLHQRWVFLEETKQSEWSGLQYLKDLMIISGILIAIGATWWRSG